MDTQIIRTRLNQSTLELVQGDITKQDTDAIVNAANSSLLGGGGVDGAIHRAAGSDLLKETSQLGGCATGTAKISAGYRLKAKHIIHAVGPVYRPNDEQSAKLLASAYRHSLELAVAHHVKTISFPAISTGVYGYPLKEAAPLALKTVLDFMRDHADITLARFVLYDAAAMQAFATALTALVAATPDIQFEKK